MKRLHLWFIFGLLICVTGFKPAFAVGLPSTRDGTPFCGGSTWRPNNLRYARTLENLNVGQPREVRLVYFLPADRQSRPEVMQRMKVEILIHQIFFAKQMGVHGHGNPTFRVETDESGEPIVHVVKGQHPDRYYISSQNSVFSEVQSKYNLFNNVYFIVIDNEDKDLNGNGLRGLGSRYSKSGGSALVTDELVTNEHERFIAAHELGHAFGLLHDFRDGAYLMSYGPGIDRLSSCAAHFLAGHPYFNPEVPIDVGLQPTIEFVSAPNYPPDSETIPLQFRIDDSDGILQTLLFVRTAASHSSAGFLEMKACSKPERDGDSIFTFDYDGVIPSAPLTTNLSNPTVHSILVSTVDVRGDYNSKTLVIAEIPRDDVEVAIPDPNLRAAIGTALGLPPNTRLSQDQLGTLTELYAEESSIIDLTGLDWAVNLEVLYLPVNRISNLTPLSGLTHLTTLDLYANDISDVSPLSDLINLSVLYLDVNEIEDISALSGLTHLFELTLSENSISDVSPLSGLLNLEILVLDANEIEDVSALSGLTHLFELALSENSISDLAPLAANAGLSDGDWVYLVGNPLSPESIDAHIPTLESRGVLVEFGNQFEESPEATSESVVSFVPSPVPSPAVGEQLTLTLNIAGGENVAGYQATVWYDDSALRYISSDIGDYLPAGAFPLRATPCENKVKLGGFSFAGGNTGDGALATLTFEVIAPKASTIMLLNVILSDIEGTASHPYVEDGHVMEPRQRKRDINRDGIENVQDVVLVAGQFGQPGQNDADVNGDGIVNILDLVLVAAALENKAAAPSMDSGVPAMLTAAQVERWLAQAQTLDLTDAVTRRGVLFLERLFATFAPEETMLLPNYPNPFNPETWIPYHLAAAAEVTLTIYDTQGKEVRRLDVGHQNAGYYTTRATAAYWDGRNAVGATVASGVYFYHLSAGGYSETRRLAILK